MEITFDLYKLITDKNMGDGSVISKSQELILIREDIDLFLFETRNDDSKKIFWAKKNEANFLGSLHEDWSEEKIFERKEYINCVF